MRPDSPDCRLARGYLQLPGTVGLSVKSKISQFKFLVDLKVPFTVVFDKKSEVEIKNREQYVPVLDVWVHDDLNVTTFQRRYCSRI